MGLSSNFQPFLEIDDSVQNILILLLFLFDLNFHIFMLSISCDLLSLEQVKLSVFCFHLLLEVLASVGKLFDLILQLLNQNIRNRVTLIIMRKLRFES